MIKRLIPFAYASSIFDVDPSFYKKLGIKVILSDLDNTLDSFKSQSPSEKTKEFVAKIQEQGIRFLIVSNNKGERVRKYAEALGVQAVPFMLKPFRFKFVKFLKKEGIANNEAIIIGDQIFTDVMAGNGAKIKTLLLDKLVPEDPAWTRFKRIFETPIRKKLLKKKLVKDWKECLETEQ